VRRSYNATVVHNTDTSGEDHCRTGTGRDVFRVALPRQSVVVVWIIKTFWNSHEFAQNFATVQNLPPDTSPSTGPTVFYEIILDTYVRDPEQNGSNRLNDINPSGLSRNLYVWKINSWSFSRLNDKRLKSQTETTLKRPEQWKTEISDLDPVDQRPVTKWPFRHVARTLSLRRRVVVGRKQIPTCTGPATEPRRWRRFDRLENVVPRHVAALYANADTCRYEDGRV